MKNDITCIFLQNLKGVVVHYMVFVLINLLRVYNFLVKILSFENTIFIPTLLSIIVITYESSILKNLLNSWYFLENLLLIIPKYSIHSYSDSYFNYCKKIS